MPDDVGARLGALPDREQTAREFALAPASREGVGDLKPATVISDAIVGAHARTLAFVPQGFFRGIAYDVGGLSGATCG